MEVIINSRGENFRKRTVSSTSTRVPRPISENPDPGNNENRYYHRIYIKKERNPSYSKNILIPSAHACYDIKRVLFNQFFSLKKKYEGRLKSTMSILLYVTKRHIIKQSIPQNCVTDLNIDINCLSSKR